MCLSHAVDVCVCVCVYVWLYHNCYVSNCANQFSSFSLFFPCLQLAEMEARVVGAEARAEIAEEKVMIKTAWW